MVDFRFLRCVAAVGLIVLIGCGKSVPPAADSSGSSQPSIATAPRSSVPAPKPVEYQPQPSIYVNAVTEIENPIVVIHTSAGDIKVALELEKSPQTVLNFLENYVRSGFYEQTVFHFADPDSFIMAGGFSADLQTKETRFPIFNESNNGLSNVRGTIAMSRDANSAHSATSQFFINVQDNTDLDYRGVDSDAARGYCVFGRVIEGMEIVDQIAQSQIRQEGEFERLPVEPVVIQSLDEL